VIIQISPAPNPVANVWVQFGYNTSPVQMITNQALPAISTSQLLMMGYAASTGGSTNYHEIRNLLVTNAKYEHRDRPGHYQNSSRYVEQPGHKCCSRGGAYAIWLLPATTVPTT
jgi:hypothetical protein